MPDQVRQKVLEIVAEQAVVAVSDIDTKHSLQDLGMDSLGLVEAVFAIEEAFDISIPFNSNSTGASAFDISTIDAMIHAVEGLVLERVA